MVKYDLEIFTEEEDITIKNVEGELPRVKEFYRLFDPENKNLKKDYVVSEVIHRGNYLKRPNEIVLMNPLVIIRTKGIQKTSFYR